VIRWQVILRILSYVALVGTLLQILPFALAVIDGDSGIQPFLIAMTISSAAGAVLYWLTGPVRTELSNREGILIVVTAWVLLSTVGAIPFYLSPYFPSFTDAVFESVSGFTTTGSTVLPSVEVLPRSLQFWRCFSHWIGGMGIILLGVAILPLVGVGGIVLYRAEFSGARSEKLTPRIAETASSLWKIYVTLSLFQFVGLRVAGMNIFESVCHTFSTMGTGGFSTRTASIQAFDNAAVETVIVVFMLLAGVNFTLQYRLAVEHRMGRLARDPELRWYLGIALFSSLAIAAALVFRLGYGFARALRAAVFQVASITTTTGFATCDFEVWPPFAQLILLALMFLGGCTGSTAGGLKTARVVLLIKVVGREFRRLIERRGVFPVRLGDQVIADTAAQGLLNLVYLAFLVNFSASILLTALGSDVLTSITAVASSMFNIGPGLGAVGPFDHYGHLPAASKWVLSFCMLAGRLEFYTALVLLVPDFWRR
jgi:trk system potassium uptake protein TrkH